MTNEEAKAYLLLLRLGFYEAYDRKLDEALEQEDPLSDLTLALALCGADLNDTISQLKSFTDHKDINDEAVLDLVWQEIQWLYCNGVLRSWQLPDVIATLYCYAGFPDTDLWNTVRECYYDYEDDLISLEYLVEILKPFLLAERGEKRCFSQLPT